MPKGDHLAEFQQLVLWTVVRLGAEAYGMRIREELEKATGRAVSIGATYTTLKRLEEKGFASARMGKPTAERGGRAKRYFAITGAGARALQESRAALSRVAGVPVVEVSP